MAHSELLQQLIFIHTLLLNLLIHFSVTGKQTEFFFQDILKVDLVNDNLLRISNFHEVGVYLGALQSLILLHIDSIKQIQVILEKTGVLI